MMFKRLICLVSLALALGAAEDARAELVGHWRLDSSAADSSGRGLDGEIFGNPNWVDGKVAGAMEIDGDDWIEIPGTSAADGYAGLSGEVTWAAWFKTSNSGVINSLMTLGPPGAAHVRGNRSINIEASGAIMIRANSVGALTSVSSSAIVDDGEWHHVAVSIVFETSGANDTMKVYIDGDLAKGFETDAIDINQHSGDATDFIIALGARGTTPFSGLIDDVRIYDHVLTEAEILTAMAGGGGGNPLAGAPSPADGIQYENTWANLGWRAGYYAVSHDLYFGTSFDDVNDGAEGTFVGNLGTATSQVVGFPTFPAPGGLLPGTTYYWRIDEVNDANAASPWKGDVWSFWVPPKIAYEPDPAEDAKFVLTNVTLGWTPGFGTKLHHVYFGDSFDDVSNAAGALPQTETTFAPGAIELERTYYWRVDEFDGLTMNKGDVWSFTTMPFIEMTDDPNLVGWWKVDEGEGKTAVDYSGYGHHGTINDGPIWVDGYDGGALEFGGADDFVEMPDYAGVTGTHSRTVTAWINTAVIGEVASWGQNVAGQKWIFRVQESNGADGAIRVEVNGGYQVGSIDLRDGQWHHVAAVLADDGTPDVMEITLYVDGWQEIISAQLDEPIDTAASGNMRIGQSPWGSRPFTGLIDDVRIYDKVLTQDEIRLVMRIDPLLAWQPSPRSGSTPDIESATPLGFSPGDSASGHDVYFGADEDAVKNADASDATGIYRGRQSGASFTPAEGVEWGGGPYYWRVDESNTDGTVTKGRVWSFTVADFILVDDFETYDANDSQIWFSWHDGLGFGAPGTAGFFAGNGTGAAVGDETTTSFTEESIVHGGAQAMPLFYDNNKQGFAKYSETDLTLASPRDWTKHGVGALSLWFRGYPPSVGSFTEGPVGAFTMTASGADIWGTADQFHFAYKILTGSGTIIARVDSVQDTHAWAKAGVMIRETLDADSRHAFAIVSAGSGVASQGRTSTGGSPFGTTEAGIVAPHWVRLVRDVGGNFTVSHSTNGSTWTPVAGAVPTNIPMTSNVYVGLALTSHDNAQTCEAKFSNVSITGTVGPQWAHQDIGILGNAAEPLYAALTDTAGAVAVVIHDDPDVATIDTWSEWVIDLKAFADQGVNLADIDKIAIGLGTQGNATVPGGSGTLFIDDIRLYQPTPVKP